MIEPIAKNFLKTGYDALNQDNFYLNELVSLEVTLRFLKTHPRVVNSSICYLKEAKLFLLQDKLIVSYY